MQVRIDGSIRSNLKDLRLLSLAFQASVMPTNQELWSEIEKQINTFFNSLKIEEINMLDTISSAREAYKKCGKDPSRYRPAADSLLRRIVKGNGLYKVNNVVDILNLISAKSGISIGGYDVSKVHGEAVLTTGTASDEYFGIGRGLLNIRNLPALADEKGFFGTPTSDSERTMICERSENICFVFYDFGKSEKTIAFLNECKSLLKRYANATGFRSETVEVVSESL